MKGIRQLFGGFLAVMMIAGCAAGGGEAGKTGETSTKDAGASAKGADLTVGVVFDRGGRGDKSFNDSAWRGVERAMSELGVKSRSVESPTEADFEPNLRALADQGAGLIIAVGLAQKSAVEKVAPEYPNVKFALVDEVVDQPNVRSLRFREEEGSFLVGYLAGLMTKTGKVGFVGGMEIPLIKKFYAGFAAGAKAANPNVEILPEKYTGNWDNSDTAKVAANVLFGQGADIVYHAAGRAGLGVIEAAREQNKFAIGVDSDQDDIAPGRVLTSMIKRVDEAVFQTIKDLLDGNFTAGEKIYDLKANGVGISELRHTKDVIGAENLAKLEAVRQEIIAGRQTVPADAESLQRVLSGN